LDNGGSALDMALGDDYLFMSCGAKGAPTIGKGEHRMLRKSSAAAAVIAFATVGSALFGGAALASDNGDEEVAPAPAPAATFSGGAGGEGGDAKTVCFVVGDHTFKAKNTVGDAVGTAFTCSSSGGYGGAGGSGVAGA
jgi:hypothetical protein